MLIKRRKQKHLYRNKINEDITGEATVYTLLPLLVKML